MGNALELNGPANFRVVGNPETDPLPLPRYYAEIASFHAYATIETMPRT